jgi:hypothetical protein
MKPETLPETINVPLTLDEDVTYELIQNDEWCAGSTSLADILHYKMVYEQDGPCEIYEVTRRKIDADECI